MSVAEPFGLDVGETSEVPLLTARDVVVRYGGLTALDGITVGVPQGEVVGVIGPNGSGKSTLINVIAGTTRPDSGEVVLAGETLDGHGPTSRARSRIGRTFQNVRLFDSMSVMDNVLLGATIRYKSTLAGSVLRSRKSRREEKEAKDHAVSILSVFGNRLVPRLKHPVGTLSYANRRRVEITRSLMMQPLIVLLDEPMAGMNPHESWELAEQLPGLLEQEQCSALMVEHKMDIISHLCKTVHVLDHGQEIVHGSPATVVEDARVQEAFLGV